MRGARKEVNLFMGKNLLGYRKTFYADGAFLQMWKICS